MRRQDVIQPDGWAAPRGYANGILVSGGSLLFIAGQIGWDAEQRLVSTDFVAQFVQALDNVLAVVRSAGGVATDIVNMTIFTSEIAEYRARAKDIAPHWRERLGRHYPAMALIGVKELVDIGALVEIQAQALISRPGEN